MVILASMSREHFFQVELLKESTIKANARFFDSVDEVPRQAITMGIGLIMKSKAILLIASGERKAEGLARLIEGGVIFMIHRRLFCTKTSGCDDYC